MPGSALTRNDRFPLPRNSRDNPRRLKIIRGASPPGVEREIDLGAERLTPQPLMALTTTGAAKTGTDSDCAKEKRTLPYTLSQVFKLLASASVAGVSAAYLAHDGGALLTALGATFLLGLLGTDYGAQLLKRCGNLLKRLRR